MASSARAARALLFMQQCRQQAAVAAPSRSHPAKSTSRTFTDNSSLDPTSFGKKLRLDSNSTEPIPEWRLPKPESQPITTTSNTTSTSSVEPTSIPTHSASTATTSANPYDFPRARDQPIPRYRHNPSVKPGFWSFVKYRVLRIPEPPNPHLTSKPTFNVLTNPYRARKSWPPILSQMSEIQQFHYEKKFRRRLLNKTRNMRYDWDRWALFLRRFSIGFVVLYFAVIAEPGDPDTRVPPDGLRYWLYGRLRRGNEVGVWPNRVAAWIEKKYQYYRLKHKRQWDPYNHEGWDVTRPVNSLPGKVAPNVNPPLGDPSRGLEG